MSIRRLPDYPSKKSPKNKALLATPIKKTLAKDIEQFLKDNPDHISDEDRRSQVPLMNHDNIPINDNPFNQLQHLVISKQEVVCATPPQIQEPINILVQQVAEISQSIPHVVPPVKTKPTKQSLEDFRRKLYKPLNTQYIQKDPLEGLSDMEVIKYYLIQISKQLSKLTTEVSQVNSYLDEYNSNDIIY
jgi:hypothetical protein